VTRRSLKIALSVTLLVSAGLLGVHFWAQLHYRAARRALDRQDFAEARRRLAPCLKVWFLGAETHLVAARAARRDRAYDEAEDYLRACRRLGARPDAVDLEYKLLRAQQGDLAAVEGYLVGRVLEDDPDTALILEVLTPAYFRTYQLANAAECVRRWLEWEPDRAQAWLWRGQLYQRAQNDQEALASYRRVVELDPDHREARLQLAGLLTQGYDPKEALGHFEYLRARHGNAPPVLLGLAHCHRLLNQPAEACRLLETLLAEEPGHGPALAQRGWLALESDSPAEAETWFRRAATAMPFEKDINYGFHQCLARLGKTREAEEVMLRMKRVEADLARLDEVTRAVSGRPHDPALRCEAGAILMRNGQEAEGLRWLESALQEAPRHPATHRALADYFERTGDAGRAARHRLLAGRPEAIPEAAP
jgi:predicted Zn-dependent protease